MTAEKQITLENNMSDCNYILKYEPKDLHWQVCEFNEVTGDLSIHMRFVNKDQAIEYFDNLNIKLIDDE